MTTNPLVPPGLRRTAGLALILGVALLGACGVAALVQGRVQVLQSYLIAYVFWIGIALGCQGLLMLHHLVGGRWGVPIRRLLEAGVATLPLMLLLFVPISFGLADLYGWARPGAVLLGNKRLYLNVPFFIIRAAVCFTIWLALGFVFRRRSVLQDYATDLRSASRLERLSPLGLVLYVLTVSFALWDWTATVDSRWYSTIYGMLIITAQAVAALAFTVIVLVRLARRPPLQEHTQPEHLQDLSGLIMAFIMMWVYLAFMQLLIIWSGNLPEEVRFYVPRLQGGFGVIGLCLVVAHFALPFVLLLNRTLKRSPAVVTAIGLLLLIGEWLHGFWLVAPDFHRPGLFCWTDGAAALGIGGLFIGTYLLRLARRPLFSAGAAYAESRAHDK